MSERYESNLCIYMLYLYVLYVIDNIYKKYNMYLNSYFKMLYVYLNDIIGGLHMLATLWS